jgi:YggT family protein
MFLLEHHIVYNTINIFFSVLIILLFVRVILSWFRVSDGNPIMLFLARATDPILLPLRRRIPPVMFLDMSWIFAFFILQILRIVFLQALPAGW